MQHRLRRMRGGGICAQCYKKGLLNSQINVSTRKGNEPDYCQKISDRASRASAGALSPNYDRCAELLFVAVDIREYQCSDLNCAKQRVDNCYRQTQYIYPSERKSDYEICRSSEKQNEIQIINTPKVWLQIFIKPKISIASRIFSYKGFAVFVYS